MPGLPFHTHGFGKKKDKNQETEKTPDGIIYEIVIDGKEGAATVSPTEHYEGKDVPTLPINMGEYSVYFIPAE